jgi:hypothetical protein
MTIQRTTTFLARRMCTLVCGTSPLALKMTRDGVVHLHGAGNHVRDIVGVVGAVDMGVMVGFDLILDGGEGGHGGRWRSSGEWGLFRVDRDELHGENLGREDLNGREDEGDIRGGVDADGELQQLVDPVVDAWSQA